VVIVDVVVVVDVVVDAVDDVLVAVVVAVQISQDLSHLASREQPLQKRLSHMACDGTKSLPQYEGSSSR